MINPWYACHGHREGVKIRLLPGDSEIEINDDQQEEPAINDQEDNAEVESDDDAPPEEVTFSKSKAAYEDFAAQIKSKKSKLKSLQLSDKVLRAVNNSLIKPCEGTLCTSLLILCLKYSFY